MFSLWGRDCADIDVKKNTYFNQTIQNMGIFSVKFLKQQADTLYTSNK